LRFPRFRQRTGEVVVAYLEAFFLVAAFFFGDAFFTADFLVAAFFLGAAFFTADFLVAAFFFGAAFFTADFFAAFLGAADFFVAAFFTAPFLAMLFLREKEWMADSSDSHSCEWESPATNRQSEK
jgi:hypothetical protein